MLRVLICGSEKHRAANYGTAVNLARSGGGTDARYIGPAASAVLKWRVQRHPSLRLDYGYFFAEECIKNSGPSQDVDYFSTWFTFRF